MKMVAASKLKKAQEQAEQSQPYAQSMAEIMGRVAENVDVGAGSSPLLVGTGKDDVHLLVVVTADRGLCGGFNGNLARMARTEIKNLEKLGKDYKIVCVGRKGRDVLKREYESRIIKSFTGIGGKSRISFAEADEIASYILEQFDAGEFDVCRLLYNEFKSVLTQNPSEHQLIPFKALESDSSNDNASEEEIEKAQLFYDFEPDEQEILGQLLPKNLGIQIFRALLDSAAGEQAARMTAMDNATRNAGDMINRLTLQYNRARQAAITKELIEIISGAEAV
jgi:F-type H+-transporting ATPase subunit gamma